MGKFSRNKGANGERELLGLLSDRLGIMLSRNLTQYQAGGADCIGLEGISLEIKRCEQLSVAQWWAQAVEQSGDRTPILAFRQSRQPWRFIVPMAWLTREPWSDTETAQIDLDCFIKLIERRSPKPPCLN